MDLTLPPTAPAHTHQHPRTGAALERLRRAMTDIEADISLHKGVYPFNHGRFTQSELCRRADVKKATLQNPVHKDTTRVEIIRWLDALNLKLTQTLVDTRDRVPLPSRPEESLITPELSPESVPGDVASIDTEATLQIWNCNTLSDLVGDNRDMHQRLLEKFLASAEKRVSAIGDAVDAGSINDIVAHAHTLKSAARSVGALALGELCQQIEITGNAGDCPDCVDLAKVLPAAFTAAMQAIREHLAH